MAWSAVSSAVLRIGQLLSQEATSLWGVEEQVQDLQRELQWMQCFLQEADKKRVTDNEVVRASVAEIRELAYDAEDVIESFILEIVSKRKAGVCNAVRRSACFLKEGWLLHKTKSGVEKITTRIKKLKSRLQTYDVRRIREELGGPSSSNARWESRRPYPHVIDDHVVGLDDDINKLVSILVNDETNFCRVVSICGMGGLGKTTLAKKIYHHHQVVNHFDDLAWSYVSQQCHNRKVWEDILSDLGLMEEDRKMKDEKLALMENEDRKMKDEKLAEKLCRVLMDKKCLVILDDIWSTEAWDCLKAAFPMRDTRSKILLTSRNKDIVHHADREGGYLFELKCLKEEQSWELFQKFVFPHTDSPGYIVDSKKETLGKDMVKACAGLPLAIIVLAGILAKKKSLNQWHTVSENVKSYLKKDGGGKVLEQVLALSYEDLPSYLKPCFLYLSHFPEDYEIPVETLIQLWVAEGFADPSDQQDIGGEFMEDVTECYLNELVERCMIQVGKRDATLKIKTCRMHDLMRDLCVSKAKQENFVYIIDHSNSFQSTRNHSSLSISRAVRRMVAHEFTPTQWITSSSHLRSLLFFGELSLKDFLNLYAEAFAIPPLVRNEDETDSDHFCGVSYRPFLERVNFMMIVPKLQGSWNCMFRKFKLLRVLGFGGEYVAFACELPSAIGNLIHLRFLSLRRVGFVGGKLPSFLGNLRYLQTLDLRLVVSRTIDIPNMIWKLEELRHLYLPKYHDLGHKTKLKLHTLTKLQTLVNFSTEYCFIQDLCSLTNLRRLEMVFVAAEEEYHFEDPMATIKSKHISSLTIECGGTIVANARNINLILSCCLSTICELSLEAEIGKLPEHLHPHFSNSNIAYLYLRWCQLEEDPMPTLEKLPNLRVLKLEFRAFMGTKMVCSAKHFPRLDSLTLAGIENLEEWEVEQGAMLALRSLEIRYCPQLKMLPQGLKFITTLQELTIGWGMPDSLKSRLERGGQDFYTVQHIPSIIFLRMKGDRRVTP